MQEPTEKPIRAALYARVSTEEQREGQTIEAQITEVERFAQGKGWTVAGVYKDDGWSGSMLARPQMDRLRDDATKDLFDAVIVNDVDRLARDVAHLGILKRDFERKQIKLIVRKLPGESSPTYNLMVNILGSFAEFEREIIIDRTRRGRRHKVEVRKQYAGCVAPYGYHYETGSATGRNEARINIVPDEAKVVRQIYQWASTGLSMAKIALRLDEQGILTRKGRNQWGIAVICRILRNSAYMGVWNFCKAESCEPVQPRSRNVYRRQRKTSRRPKPKSEWLRIMLPDLRIIEPGFWSQVQARIARNQTLSPRNTHTFYLLQGLLRCGACGGAYSGTFSGWSGRTYYYYRCWRKSCKARWRPMHVLDSLTWDVISHALLNPKKLLERVRAAQNQVEREREGKASAQETTETTTREESRLFLDYRTGKISPQQLAAKLEDLKARHPVNDHKSMGATQANDKTADQPILSLCRELSDRCRNASPQMKQDILRRLIRKTVVGPEEITIHAEIAPDVSSSEDAPAPLGIALPPSRESKDNSTGIFPFALTAAIPSGS